MEFGSSITPLAYGTALRWRSAVTVIPAISACPLIEYPVLVAPSIVPRSVMASPGNIKTRIGTACGNRDARGLPDAVDAARSEGATAECPEFRYGMAPGVRGKRHFIHANATGRPAMIPRGAQRIWFSRLDSIPTGGAGCANATGGLSCYRTKMIASGSVDILHDLAVFPRCHPD